MTKNRSLVLTMVSLVALETELHREYSIRVLAA